MPDLRSLRVAQITSQLLKAQHLKHSPNWLSTVGRTSPIQNFDRRPPPSFHAVRRSKKNKVRRVFDLQRICYAEDKLRERFYKEHPWELARPVTLVENEGDDSKHHDWSKIEQPGKQLSGESVVQRQIYLMNQNEPRLGKDQAYRRACEEFYKLRMFEAVEKRIAMEEGMAFGALFNKSQTEIGLELEDQVVARWRAQALQARNLTSPMSIASAVIPRKSISQDNDTTESYQSDVFSANLF